MKIIDGKINIADLGEIVRIIESEYAFAKTQIHDLEIQTSNYDKNFSTKYEKGIKELQGLIDISSKAPICYAESVKTLMQCENLVQYTICAAKTAKIFDNYECKSKTTKSENVESIIKHDSDIYKTLINEAFESIKDNIKKKFDITLCKQYKHYWFLQLYFGYLLNGLGTRPKKYLFIDEAQDLSPAEILLLRKVNAAKDGSICDLFGDIKQVISNYGVKDWKEIDFIDKYFELDENFRNTNQIIDYCAKKLHFSMKPVGVSLDDVKEFATLDEMLKADIVDKIFVVKDEYAVKDLEAIFANNGLKDYKVFSVKAVKGLEFKQIIVFDEDMTENEKYIAYTRALIKLYVVTSSPWNYKNRIRDIIQGDEE